MTHRIWSSAHRVSVIASNTVREGRRQRLLVFMALLAVGLVLGARLLRDFNFGTSELKFVTDFGLGAMSFFGAALTIVASSQLFFSELDQRTVLTLLAKPVGRAEFIVGKYVGMAVLTATFCVIMTGALLAVVKLREFGMHRNVPGALSSVNDVNAVGIVASGCAQWLKLLVLSAFTLLVSSFGRSQLFATGMGFTILVCGHLQFILQNTADRGGATVTRISAFIVAHSVPDFQLFDLTSGIEEGSSQWFQLGRLLVYSAIYVLAVGVLAVTAFRRREL